MNSQPHRIEHLPARLALSVAEGQERTVLRLSRESLRGERPAVRFIDNINPTVSQQRLPWSA